MQIYIDGDACPKLIKQVLFKAIERCQIQTVIVANSWLQLPISKFLKLIIVPSGFDEADNYIVKQVQSGDLVISSDIPLADQAIAKGATVLSPYGKLLTAQNIKSALATRNLMAQLRDDRVISGGPSILNSTYVKLFAQHLDKILATNKS